MSKRKKSAEGRDLAQLQSDREWLIRTNLIGKGYVVMAFEAAKDAGDETSMKLHARRLAEMELAIDGCRPAAEDVLKLLGKMVYDERKAIRTRFLDLIAHHFAHIEETDSIYEEIAAVTRDLDPEA